MPRSRKIFIAALTLVVLGAQAHDTWFQPLVVLSDGRTAAAAPQIELAMGTGNRHPLQSARNIEHALVLRPPPEAARCWAQLVPLGIELEPAKVAEYLQEAQASPALRGTWLRLAYEDATRWDGGFVTLAFEATPASLMLPLRSAAR